MKSLFHFFRLQLRSKSGFSILEVMIVGGLMTIVGLAITSVIMNSTKAQKRLEQKSSQTSIADYIQGVLQNPVVCRQAFCKTTNTNCAGGTNCCDGTNVFGSAGDLRTDATAYPSTAGIVGLVNLASIQISTGGANQQLIQRCDPAAGTLCNNNPAAYNALTNVPPSSPPYGSPVTGTPGFFVYGMRLANLTYLGVAGTEHISTGEIVLQYAQDAKNTSGGKLRDSVIRVVFSADGAGAMTACRTGSSDSLWRVNPNGADIFYNIGRVGIGTTDPIRPLHVVGTPVLDGDANTQLRIEDSRAFNAGPVAGLHFANRFDAAGTTAGMGAITVLKENATDGNTSSAMTFHTRLNAGTVTERMRINSVGNVGIGTPPLAPLAPLHIFGTALAGARIENATNPIFHMRRDASNEWFMVASPVGADRLDFRPGALGNAAVMSLLTGGNIGIGTLTPTSILNIRDTSDNNRQVLFEGRNDLTGFQIRAPNNSLHLNTGANRADAPAFTILNANGNVGIGTNAPGRKLEIVGTARVNSGAGNTEIDIATSLVTIGTPSQFNGTVTIGTGGTPANLVQTGNQTVTGNQNITGNISVSGVGEGNITATGVLTLGAIGTTHVITGPISHSGDLNSDLTGNGANAISNYATISAVSDIRLKTEVERIDSVSEQLGKLYSYRYVMRNDPTRKRHIGFIAQELLEIFPELVSESAAGYLNVNYMGMVPLLLQGFKETQARIEVLESENEHLKNVLNELTVRLEKLELRVE